MTLKDLIILINRVKFSNRSLGTKHTDKLTIEEADEIEFSVSSSSETPTTLGALINSATSKTTPVDGDQVALVDSAGSNIVKKLSWSNIKATLKTYFDTLYPSGSDITVVASGTHAA